MSFSFFTKFKYTIFFYMNTYFKPMKMGNCKLFSFVIVYFNWTDYFFCKANYKY